MMRDYPEVDLHGLFADEARDKLEQAIREAIRGGHRKLLIVHGKGTGILKREVRDLLEHHPRVLTYQSASSHDGGDGATVAALEKRR